MLTEVGCRGEEPPAIQCAPSNPPSRAMWGFRLAYVREHSATTFAMVDSQGVDSLHLGGVASFDAMDWHLGIGVSARGDGGGPYQGKC
jgi:hypothetical protein